MFFWYYAIKRAAEMSNYFPINHHGQITTPFQIAQKSKPDVHNLFLMFSIGYVRKTTDSLGKSRTKFQSQTVKSIVIGKDDKHRWTVVFLIQKQMTSRPLQIIN